MITRLLISLILFTAGACNPAIANEPADHLFTGGKVYTVHSANPWAEAVAIRNGEITFVGDDELAKGFIGPQTQVIDLGGRMLLPGFQDSHLHLTWGAEAISTCTLDEYTTPKALRMRLQECAETPGRGTENWLVGSIFERDTFPDGIPPIGFLDELFPNRPVSIVTSDGHSQWVNKSALALAGIDNNTLNPKDGIIERDPVTGEATGILDASAMDLIDKVVPPLSPAERKHWVRKAVAMANQFGITSAIDPGVNYEQSVPLKSLNDSGELDLRVLIALSPDGSKVTGFGQEIFAFLKNRNTLSGGMLQADSVKMFIDGVIENGTSPLMDGYLNDTRSIDLFYQQDELNDIITRLDKDNISVHVHAIGDLGVRRTLNAFAVTRAENGTSNARHVMTHLQLVNQQDIGRFAELDITAGFSPYWAQMGPYEYEVYPPLIGLERLQQTYPIGSIHRAGGRIAGSSDWTVTTMNPLLAIEVAMTRQDPEDPDAESLNPKERVDLATMLEAYTLNVAWLMKNESLTGSIEVGKRADLVVLDRNLFDLSAYEISEVNVEMTMLDGRFVYRRTVD